MKWLVLLLLPVMVACTAPAVYAGDMTIRFTGSFERGTCQFSVASVDLGTYAATAFDGTPQTPWTAVTVNRIGCTSDISAIHMAVLGTPHPLNSAFWQVPRIAGLAVEMRNAGGVAAVPNRTTFDWLPANASYVLQARFTKVATIGAYGRVSTPVTLSFTYN